MKGNTKLPVVLYLLLTVVPMAAGFGYSLLYSLGLTGMMNSGFTLVHWEKLIRSGDAWSSLGYSLGLTLISLVLAVACAFVAGWRLSMMENGMRLYKSLFLPLTFPPLIAGFAIYYLVAPSGIVSRLFFHLGLVDGIASFPRIVNDYWSVGIVLAHLFLVFPVLALMLTHQANKERVKQLYDLSKTLGGTAPQFIRQVFIPLLLLRMKPVIVLYGIFLFGTYEVPLLLGRTSPRVVTVYITEKLSRFNIEDIPTGHAMAVVYTVSVLIVVRILVDRRSWTLFR